MMLRKAAVKVVVHDLIRIRKKDLPSLYLTYVPPLSISPTIRAMIDRQNIDILFYLN